MATSDANKRSTNNEEKNKPSLGKAYNCFKEKKVVTCYNTNVSPPPTPFGRRKVAVGEKRKREENSNEPRKRISKTTSSNVNSSQSFPSKPGEYTYYPPRALNAITSISLYDEVKNIVTSYSNPNIIDMLTEKLKDPSLWIYEYDIDNDCAKIPYIKINCNDFERNRECLWIKEAKKLGFNVSLLKDAFSKTYLHITFKE